MSVRRLAPKELQPASFTFSEENLAWAKAQIEKYPPGRQASAVIAIMWRVQEQHEGWVSEAAIRAVADLLEMPYIRVLEVATFYTMFQLQPVGKKAHVQVCGTTPCRLRGAGDQSDGEEVPVIALDNLLDDGKIAPGGKYLIKLDVEGVEIEAMKGGARLMQGDSVLLCEEHGNDPRHTVSRYILEQTPLTLIVYDPRSNCLETMTDLSILDRIKVSTHVGYNVFGTASAFWLARIDALNAKAARRVQ